MNHSGNIRVRAPVHRGSCQEGHCVLHRRQSASVPHLLWRHQGYIIDQTQEKNAPVALGPLGDLEFLCQLCEAYFLFRFAQFPDHGNNSFVHTMFFL